MCILEHLCVAIGRDGDAVNHIQNIEELLYARHAFPLPRCGKICSTPSSRKISGLLPIHKFSPFKLLLELWYYIHVKFNERCAEALQADNIFTEPTQFCHEQNLHTFGQWGVLDDGGLQAKVQTMDHRHEFLAHSWFD